MTAQVLDGKATAAEIRAGLTERVAALGRVVARQVIIDARCCLDAGLWSDAGWTVRVLGRP